MLLIEKLYSDYKSDVFYYLVSVTHDSDLSEDLTSETFLSAIKSLSGFKGKSDIKTWLFSIARHKWYEHLRKKKDDNALSRMDGGKFEDSALVDMLKGLQKIEIPLVPSEAKKK